MGDKGCRFGCILAKEGGSPSPSLNYPSGVVGVVDSGPISPLSFCVVERLKESIPPWGPETGPASQPAEAATCHSPAVRRVFLAASDYGVISRGLCGD